MDARATKFFFCILLLLTTFYSCNKKAATTGPSVDQLPYNIIHIFEQPSFKQNYQLNNAINPFYISGNFDGDNQTDYAVYLYNKNTKKPAIALIRGENADIKELSDFSCLTNTAVLYWKETNRFPAGSGLPNRGGGVIIAAGKENIRWLYWDNDGWKCVNPK